MMMPDPNIPGYELERSINCADGGYRFIYDAAPLGYAGLKVEMIYGADAVLISEVYRVAGRTFFCPDLTVATWHREYDYRVSDLCEQPAGAIAAESRNNPDQLSGSIAASVSQTPTETRRVAAASQTAAVALSGAAAE
jgi:hypothetical protein